MGDRAGCQPKDSRTRVSSGPELAQTLSLPMPGRQGQVRQQAIWAAEPPVSLPCICVWTSTLQPHCYVVNLLTYAACYKQAYTYTPNESLSSVKLKYAVLCLLLASLQHRGRHVPYRDDNFAKQTNNSLPITLEGCLKQHIPKQVLCDLLSILFNL